MLFLSQNKLVVYF